MDTRIVVHPSRKLRSGRSRMRGPRAIVGSGEFPGKYRTQIGHAALLGMGTIDVALRLEREILPQDLKNADETEGDAVGVQVRLGSLGDQSLDQFADQRREALVLLSTNVVVFLPGTRFAPKRIPNGHFAWAGYVRVEIQIDHQFERGDRR